MNRTMTLPPHTEAASAESPGADGLHVLLARAVGQAMELAVASHRAGDLPAARQMYLSVLELAPDQPDAHHNLAALDHQSGDAAAGLPHFRRALEIDPGNETYWSSLFEALLDAGALDEATALLEQRARGGMPAAELDERVARVVALRRAGLNPRATHAAQRASDKQVRVIKDLFRREQLDEVVTRAGALTQRHPGDPFGWKALGAALVNLDRKDDALAPLARAVALAPGDVSALSNFAFALQNRGRPVEAQCHLQLALTIQPDFASALVNMGATMLSQNRYPEAAAFYRRGLEVEPGYVPAHSHLAQVDEEQGRLVDAAEGYRRTLDMLAQGPAQQAGVRTDTTQANAHQGLSNVMAKLADFGSVVAQSDAALALLPQDRVLWEKRLYAFSYHPDLAVDDIFAEFVRWGDLHPRPATDFSRHDRTPGRRLKVAYVSPDFRRHTSRFYFHPLFANHDHAQLELFAYSNVRAEDAFTRKFRQCFDHWRDIRDRSDEEVAQMARDDGIDILVDCCNHMRDDRLGVFALKPAPVQVTWLGAAWTTGLATVDYVLYDQYLAPPETIARETIVRLPHCFAAYDPLAASDAPRPPPCLRNGYVTFAYSGRTERLNHHTFRVWGEILRRMPGARLVLDFKHFTDPRNQAYFVRLMREQGVDTDRVDMRNSSNIFTGLHDFDIVLDSFPHSGGTMLVDALWMGVPTLTLAGRPPLGRIGSTFMMNLGLPEWIAQDEAGFVDKAVAFASDPQALARLRAGMRERMLNSPFMDGPGFSRAVEWAFRAMWTRYCQGLPAQAIDVPSQARAA